MTAEELWFGESGTGPGSDLAQATTIAATMVGALGMAGSLVSFQASGGGVLDSGLISRVLGDDKARNEVEKILDRSKESVRELLDANRHLVEALRDELLVREELVGDEITGVLEEARLGREVVSGGHNRRTGSRSTAGVKPSTPLMGRPGEPRRAAGLDSRPRGARAGGSCARGQPAAVGGSAGSAGRWSGPRRSSPSRCSPRPRSTTACARVTRAKVIRLTVIMVLIGIVQAICTGLRRYAAFRIALRTETDLRQRLFAHLQRLHFAFHDQAQTGQLMARANTDIQQVQTVVILIPLTIASLLTMSGVLVIMVLKNAILALLALGALPFLNVAATRFSHRIAPVNLALQEELADVSGVVEESLSGIRVVKGFGAEQQQIRRLQAEADSVLDRSLAAARLRAGFMPLVDFLPTVSMVAILWYGGHQVLDGHLQVGDILAFNLYILMLIWPMRMMGMLVAQASRASAGAGRVHEILATDPAIADAPHAVPLPPGPGTVRFEGVRFRVRPGPVRARRARSRDPRR